MDGRSLAALLLASLLLMAFAPATAAQGPGATISAGEAQLQKCEERIASVQREILSRYETALAELQETFQKAADLEGALAVRGERQRIQQEPLLSDKNLVAEPRALRSLQQLMIAKQKELLATVVNETLPLLLEQKRALTISGKLDEAVALRSAIESLQAEHLPLVRPAAGTVIPAESLLQNYAANRSRADRLYKGQRLTIRGTLGGIRPDPAQPNRVAVFIGSNSGGGWVECTFQPPEALVREEQQYNASFITFTSGGGAPPVRMQRGQTIEVRGTCEGWDEMVRLSRCELVR